jgi:hypothetical protein
LGGAQPPTIKKKNFFTTREVIKHKIFTLTQVDRSDCSIASDPIGKTIGFNRIRLGSFALGFSCFFFVDTKSCRRTAVLSGRNADVQAILRQSYMITKIYVHCFAHRLNLVIHDISKGVPYLFECYSVVSKIYTCFHSSSVINECFKSIQQQLVSDKINYLTQHHHVETQLDK